MPDKLYIDIHTHKTAHTNGESRIVNKQDDFETVSEDDLYSMGIHPWFIRDEAKIQLASLAEQAGKESVVAIGECGLDRLSTIPFTLQQRVFEAQIHLANELNKPLIIHCVKAFDDALLLLRQAKVPVIFHGFDKKQGVAQQVLNAGYFLSFGAAIASGSTQASVVLAAIPGNRFFLETDDKDINIQEIYKIAAAIRKTEVDAIILQVQQNYHKVFGL